QGLPPPSPPPDRCVYRHVQKQHEDAEPPLNAAVEPRRIEDGDDVVLDEAAGVAGLSTQTAEVILQRRQGTDGLGKLDADPPDRRRQVDPCGARPAQGEKPSQDHEEDEAEVEEDDEVREEPVEHRRLTAPGDPRGAPSGLPCDRGPRARPCPADRPAPESILPGPWSTREARRPAPS